MAERPGERSGFFANQHKQISRPADKLSDASPVTSPCKVCRPERDEAGAITPRRHKERKYGNGTAVRRDEDRTGERGSRRPPRHFPFHDPPLPRQSRARSDWRETCREKKPG